MESKFVFREGKYKLVHTTNTLRDNLLVNSSQIEPEIDTKLKKIEVAINNAHLPFQYLRKVVKVLILVLLMTVFVWVVCWIMGLGNKTNYMNDDNTFTIKDGQLVTANGLVVKNGYLSCNVIEKNGERKFDCKYNRNQNVAIMEVEEPAQPVDTSIKDEKTVENIIIEPVKETNTEKEETRFEKNKETDFIYDAPKKFEQKVYENPKKYQQEIPDNTRNYEEKTYEKSKKYDDATYSRPTMHSEETYERPTQNVPMPYERSNNHEEHRIHKDASNNNDFEFQLVPKRNYKESTESHNDSNDYIDDIYRNYGVFDQQQKNNHKKESKPLETSNYYDGDVNSSYRNYLNNKDSNFQQEFERKKPYSYSSTPYNYYNNSRRLMEENENDANYSSQDTTQLNTNNFISDEVTRRLSIVAPSDDGSQNFTVENMPIEIDGKWYHIRHAPYVVQKGFFLPSVLMLILLILILELCIRILALRTDAHLNKSIAHLINLENRANCPIKLVINSEYTFIEVKVLGILEPNKDQELTSEDNLYKSHNDSKHYFDRKLGKLQKKVKKHKPKYDNYLNPSDDSLDISMRSETHMNRKNNTEASFVLNTNK